jgi:hypothetical protein
MAASDIFRDVCAWTSLRDAIRAWYGIESEHVGCEHVVETCDDSVLWEGSVEVFRVLDDPRASFVYAWSDDASAGGPSHVACWVRRRSRECEMRCTRSWRRDYAPDSAP